MYVRAESMKTGRIFRKSGEDVAALAVLVARKEKSRHVATD